MPQSRCPIYNATQCSNSKRKREWHRCSACRTHVSQGLRGGMTSETVRRFSAIPFQLGFPGCWPKNPLDLPTKPRLTVFLPNSLPSPENNKLETDIYRWDRKYYFSKNLGWLSSSFVNDFNITYEVNVR